MQIVGFNFTKLNGEKNSKITKKPSTSVEFINLEKEKAELLVDGNIVRIDFTYTVSFTDSEKKEETPEALIQCNGQIALSVTKDELKEVTKSWKKKKLPGNMNVYLFNLILKRCTPKAIALEDELGIIFHVPMPQIQKKQS